MTRETNPPSIRETAFECPFCGAFTTQYWFSTAGMRRPEEHPLPTIWTTEEVKAWLENPELPKAEKDELLPILQKWASGLVGFSGTTWESGHPLCNLHLSKCYNCGKLAIWVHEALVFPYERQGPQPNPDMPEDIIKDFEEARSILGPSPRGSAAMLRLCIQKICIHLGEKGENLNQDVAALVKRGLNPLVQRALDIVRVIGNEAVHPGVIDLNDDRKIAERLFGLVNAIVEQMITHPKHVEELYGKLPKEKREAIEKRDGHTCT